ncbi:hypothetical protein TNIN_210091 [Trichonephila inaurata madagascariensis]|uniref:Uncharacterized protein n=1 Tax=Trichonephila inaurata madagascariensis TaxID=2747483 RepID=A0A8X6IGU4_9ARAC|nr:hypothetical protein TNIN_210091 [Trichonephila inaurata madagascariensis]
MRQLTLFYPTNRIARYPLWLMNNLQRLFLQTIASSCHPSNATLIPTNPGSFMLTTQDSQRYGHIHYSVMGRRTFVPCSDSYTTMGQLWGGRRTLF